MASKAAKLGLGLYQHSSAVLASFGLAAIIGHFWDIEWKSFLASVVGVWDQTVRPAAAQLFRIFVSIPLDWVGIDFEVPQFVRDYVSVGAVLALSVVREGRRLAKLYGTTRRA